MNRTRNDALIAALFEEAEATDGIVHTAAGPLRDALNRRTRRESLLSPHPGHFARRDRWMALDPAERCRRLVRSLARAHPDWVFAGPTAALMHGLQVPYRQLARITVIGGCNRRIGAVHAIDRPAAPTTVVGGVRVAALDHAAFDTMRALPFRLALGVADSLLRLTGRSADEEIQRIGALKRGFRGVRRVRETLAAADARSESGGESYARAVMIEEGIQVPELQVEYRIPGSRSCRRVDFDWGFRCGGRAVHVLGELVGIQRLTWPGMTGARPIASTPREELDRDARLATMGLHVIRFTLDDCVRTEPLVRALAAHGIPGADAALARRHDREARAG